MNRRLKLVVLTLVGAFVFAGAKCANDTNREAGAKEQKEAIERARQAVPTPKTSNFLTRKNVSEWMKRMDDPQKTWYVYVLADNGQKLGYYVARTRPISVCTYLTQTDKVLDWYEPEPVVNAPSLDGVWRPNGACGGGVFFFTASSDAYVELGGNLKYFVTDQPLGLDVEPIRVETAGDV